MEKLGQVPETRRPGVGQEESACGMVFEEDQVSRVDGVDTARGAYFPDQEQLPPQL